MILAWLRFVSAYLILCLFCHDIRADERFYDYYLGYQVTAKNSLNCRFGPNLSFPVSYVARTGEFLSVLGGEGGLSVQEDSRGNVWALVLSEESQEACWVMLRDYHVQPLTQKEMVSHIEDETCSLFYDGETIAVAETPNHVIYYCLRGASAAYLEFKKNGDDLDLMTQLKENSEVLDRESTITFQEDDYSYISDKPFEVPLQWWMVCRGRDLLIKEPITTYQYTERLPE